MKSNKYWENRANERMATYHKNSDSTINVITNAYDKAIKDIKKDIDKIFAKMAIDGGLDEKTATRYLNQKIPNFMLKAMKKYYPKAKNEDIRRWLLSRINAPAYRARITRLEALKQSIYLESKMIADVEITASTNQYIKTINDAYYKHLFDIQKGIGTGFDVAVMSNKTIESILKNPWSGKHFSTRVWDNTDVLAEKLTEIVTSGFMSGRSIPRMVRELQEYADYGKYAATRLVRTETTYMANMAEMESYKECDIEKYIYVATLDNRTSKECQVLDRKVFEVKKGCPGENVPPLHPHCRSTTRAYLGEDTLKGIQRRARDPKTGKTYLVPADMDYKDWYQKHVVNKYGKDEAEVMKKMVINKASDKRQYTTYKLVLKKDLKVKSFDEFQYMKYNKIKEWKNIKHNYRVESLKYKDYLFNKDGTIIVSDDWKGKHVSIPKEYKPFAVIETSTEYKNGYIQIDRTIYNEQGKMFKQIHSGHHNKPKLHQYGLNGEHVHIYKWSEESKKPDRITTELTEKDRFEHKDIL